MSGLRRTLSSTLLQRLDRDALVDALMPTELRHLSAVHWTPFDVALQAARLLAPRPGMRVLDVGAGVGKACLVGAMSTAAIWYGIEQHRGLVDAASRAAEALGVASRTRFVHGDALSIDWAGFDAVYLYNPFEMLLFRPGDHHAFDAQIAAVEVRLAALDPGVRVVTFHGFGGEMPDGYDLISEEPACTGRLALWIRRKPARARIAPTPPAA